MDVFNSALRNPLPPSRRQFRRSGDSGPTSDEDPSTSGPSSPKQSVSSARRDEPDLRMTHKKKTSRRKHRNSHLGCGICKKRRIKCDENLPQCFNCLKGKLECAYLKLDAPARNALRMAQYNQNLRDDKQEEAAYVAELSSSTFVPKEPQADASQIPIVINHPEYYPTYVSNRMGPINQPYLPMQQVPTFQGQYPRDGSMSKLVNSPYGPVVQFQSLSQGMSYAVPLQIMNNPQVMYQGSEQLQYNVPNPPMQTLPVPNLVSIPPHSTAATSGIPFKQTPQSSYDAAYYPAHPQANGHATAVGQPVPNLPSVEIPSGADMVSPLQHDQGDPISRAAPRVSLSASPSSATNTPLSLNTNNPSRASPADKDISSSSTSKTNSELGLRPPMLDAVSDITSPSLQSAVSAISQPLEGNNASLRNGGRRVKSPVVYEPNIKLAPIRTKNEGEKELPPEDVKDSEKVPSIRMLLS